MTLLPGFVLMTLAWTSLNFVLVLFLSRWILKEKIDWPKRVGVFVILIGLLGMVSV